MLITKSEFQKICELVWLTSVLRLIRKGEISENSSGLIDLKDIKTIKYIKNRKKELSKKAQIKVNQEDLNLDIMNICGDEINKIGKKVVTKTEFKNMFKIAWLSSVSHLLKNGVIVANSDGLINLEAVKNKIYIKNRKLKLALRAV